VKQTSFRGHRFNYLEEGLEPYYMFEGWEHERNSREHCLRDNDVFMDVGACNGGWSIPAALIAKQVYAFEPEPANARILCCNALINGLTNLAVINRAVWSKDGPVEFTGWNVQNGEGATAVTLDTFCDENNIIPDFIKIDVEGAEFEVIEGAKFTIKTHRPRLMVEAHKEYNPNAAPLVEQRVMDLNPGYKMSVIFDNGWQVSHLYFEGWG